MPLYKLIKENDISIAIWHPTENIQYFENKIHSKFSKTEKEYYNSISHPNRKKEYLVSRYLIHLLLNTKERLSIKKNNNKPILGKTEYHISISHSKDYIAVSTSRYNHSIDIENPERITEELINRVKSYFSPEILDDYSNEDLWLLRECSIKLQQNDKSNSNFISLKLKSNLILGYLSKKILNFKCETKKPSKC